MLVILYTFFHGIVHETFWFDFDDCNYSNVIVTDDLVLSVQ